MQSQYASAARVAINWRGYCVPTDALISLAAK
jgi:hypothetical protein